jgi:hypothetical protein
VTCPSSIRAMAGGFGGGLSGPPLPFSTVGCPASDGTTPWGATLVIASAAFGVALLSSWAARLSPKRGHYMLPALGVLASIGIVITMFTTTGGKTNVDFAPVAIGIVLFFYLWWLSALLFDLVFAWQRYVRASTVRAHLEQMSPSR